MVPLKFTLAIAPAVLEKTPAHIALVLPGLLTLIMPVTGLSGVPMVASPAAVWIDSPVVKEGIVLVVFMVTFVANRVAGRPVSAAVVVWRFTAKGTLVPEGEMTWTPGSSVTVMGVWVLLTLMPVG
jgi:hypothetical protein